MSAPSDAKVKWIVQDASLNATTATGNSGNCSLYVTRDGDIYLAYEVQAAVSGSGAFIGSSDTVMAKYSTSGSKLWGAGGSLFNQGGSDVTAQIFVDSSGSIYLGTRPQGPLSGIQGGGGVNRDSSLYKFNSDATQRIWAVNYPISSNLNDNNVRTAFDPVTRASYISMTAESGGVSSWPNGGVSSAGGSDLIVGKVSADGVTEWVIQRALFNTAGTELPQYMCVAPDGHLLIAYQSTSLPAGSGLTNVGGTNDIALMKIDKSNGTILWHKRDNTITSNAVDECTDMRVDPSGNIYLALSVTGAISGTTALGGNDVVIVKLDSSGNRTWATRSNQLNTSVNETKPSIDVDTSGNIYVLFSSTGTLTGQSKVGSDDISIAKLTSSGTVEWVWTPTQLNTTGADIAPTTGTPMRIALDKYRNIYLFYVTAVPLSGVTGVSTGRNYALVKLGPDAQVSYDPAPAVITPTLTPTTVTASSILEDTVPNGTSVDEIVTSLGANYVTTSTEKGIAIFSADSANGIWYYSTNNGVAWTQFPAVSASSYLLLKGSSTLIRYVPSTNSNASTSIQYVAWSGYGYDSGETAAITTGAGTAFSSGAATTVITVTPVNDAPTMSEGIYVLPDLSTLTTDTGVSTSTVLSSFTITDADISSGFGIAIVTTDVSLGSWEFSENNGSTWTVLDSVSAASAVHLDICANTLLRFIPTSTTTIGPTTLTFVAWDKSNAGNLVNKRASAVSRGGATPYSVSVGTLTRTVIAAPSVPRTVKAIVDPQSITFTWSAPLFYGSGDAMTYKIYDASNQIVTTTNNTTATVSTPGQTPFAFKISASNAVLEGSTTTQIAYLGTPVLADIERSHMELELSWLAAYAQGLSGVVLYSVLDASDAVLQSGLTDTSYIVSTGLTAGQAKTYRIQASANGMTTHSVLKTAVVPFVPVPSPGTPVGGNAQITITWPNVSTQVQGGLFLGYKIYYRRDGFTEYMASLISETSTTITGISGDFSAITINQTSALFTGLTNGALYKFRVVAIVSIDGVTYDGVSSATVSAVPIAPEITVVDLASVITTTAGQSDTSAAVTAITALTSTQAGVTTASASLSQLSAGSANDKAAGAAVFVGLPVTNASAILSSILATQTAEVKASMLQEAISANPTKVGNAIGALTTTSERMDAIQAAVSSAVNATTSIVSAALASGIVGSTAVARAVGAADLSTRITVNDVKTNVNSLVTSFGATIGEAKSVGAGQKLDIAAGAAQEILRIGNAVSDDTTVTTVQRTAAKVNALTAVLSEANGADVDPSLKNTFVTAIREAFAGQAIPVSGTARAALINSIPAGRISTALLNPTAPITVVVPTANVILLSTTTDNQFVAMEVDTQYTFKHAEIPSQTLTATYRQGVSGDRYLELGGGVELSLGGSVQLFGSSFFLAAAANPTFSKDNTANTGGGDFVPCFLAGAPVLTPSGYQKIEELIEGDLVTTGDGRHVTIQRVKRTLVTASPSVNPYVIPKGRFGAVKRLLISPNHKVQTGDGFTEARELGLRQEEQSGQFVYYNLELPEWSRDTLVVAGVVCEPLAPVHRITMPLAAFSAILTKKYGGLTPALVEKVMRTCRMLPNGLVEAPAMRR
jgi:hypothetical protein